VEVALGAGDGFDLKLLGELLVCPDAGAIDARNGRDVLMAG
jgi:hypothetical protein